MLTSTKILFSVVLALAFIKLQAKSIKYIPEDGDSTRIKWGRRHDWDDDDNDDDGDKDDDDDDYRQYRRYGNKRYGFRCYKMDYDDDERRPRLYHSRGYRYRKDRDNDDD
ncbi:unnamed protein product [Hymenolepis diminuta]|uniref:Secreted protein n=1 Tax=Hymenolepis diminuta TaxID=6216 RepID=A0A0R3SGB6_HYMDI|nr:unnamed protein product [Hymenolepis diminuta]